MSPPSTQKEDEIEEYLRKKYADESIAKRHFGDGGEEMSDEITQQTLLPGIKYVLQTLASLKYFTIPFASKQRS